MKDFSSHALPPAGSGRLGRFLLLAALIQAAAFGGWTREAFAQDTVAPTISITSPTSSTTYTTTSPSVNVGGAASDNVGVIQVTWTNDRGGGGIATGTSTWSAAGIALQPGANILTVTARDAAGKTGTDVLTVTFNDTVFPTVTITSPTANPTYAASFQPIDIGGTASDNAAVTQVSWTNDRGGGGIATGTSTWSATGINLQPGLNIITVTARDTANKTGTDTLAVTFTDSISPVVTITSPTSDPTFATSNQPLVIGGTGSDNIGVTQVTWTNDRGGGGAAIGTTNWSVAGIALQPGINVITVTARDAANNVATDTITVTFNDTGPPAVAITSPTPSPTYSTTTQALDLGGTASDNVGVTQVSWTNDRGGGGIAAGTTNWSVAGIALQAGNNVIAVTARDAANNAATAAITVTFNDTIAPTVTITSPTSNPNYSTTAQTLDLSGTASDNAEVTQVSWTNNRGGGGIATGTTSWSVSGIALQPGANVVTVSARDSAGNLATAAITATFNDTAPPTIAIVSPSANPSYITTTQTLDLSGTAADNAGVMQVSWTNDRGGGGIATGTTNWTVTGIVLQAGINVITVSARDASNNAGTDAITVTFNDTVAPTIAITMPAPGPAYATTSRTLDLGGSASDNIAVTQVTWINDRGGGGVAAGTTNWSVTGITLQPGANVLTVTARDAANKTATDTLTVTFNDTVPPAVTITSPTSDPAYATTTQGLEIGGTASDNIAVTQVTWTNDRGGGGSASGITNWTITGIALQPGSNIIAVTVRDASNNTATDTITVAYTDTIPPAVTITSPTSNPTHTATTQALNIGGSASDDTVVTQVTWTNDRGGSGTAAGTTTWSVAGIGLQPGSNVITVTALDGGGNTRSAVLTVTYTDTTVPTVAITAPTSNATYTSTSLSLGIGGSASDNVSVAQVTWANSRGGSGTATGTTAWSVTGIALQTGSNVITVTAKDAANNAASDTITVTFNDTVSPTVSITSPTSNTTYATSTQPFDLGGSASDNVAVTQVTWANSRGGSGTATGTTNWTVTGITLQPGSNVITVTAKDAANKSATDSITVTFTDTSPPTITITAPTSSPAYSTRAQSLSIGGTATDNTAVTLVTWTNDRGGSGTAAGTANWTVTGIALQTGVNLITVTAKDAANNTAVDTISVTYSTACYTQAFEAGAPGWSPTGFWHLTTACASATGTHSPPTSFYFGQDVRCDYDTGARTAGALLSPVIDLSSSTGPLNARFFYYLKTERAATRDRATVEIWDGSTWTTIDADASNGGALVDNGIWTQAAYDISSFAGMRIRFRFSFDTVDAVNNQNDGWFIDDFEIVGSCGVCAQQADFDGDGRLDILWRNISTNEVALWLLDNSNNPTSAALEALTDSRWRIVGTGDFNGDGKPDILIRNTSNGQNYVRFMNGLTQGGEVFLETVSDLKWRIVAVADFNGDGKPDILWRNYSTGDNYVWFMNGTARTDGTFLLPLADLNWRVAGAADFNGDGKPDILWRNPATGENYVWFMNGTARTDGTYLLPLADPNWKIVALGDYNRDARPDILWRNSSIGVNLLWLMNGTTRTGTASLQARPDTNWLIGDLTGEQDVVIVIRFSGWR